MAEIYYSAGGSHRQFTNDKRLLTANGIPFRQRGSLTYGSKKQSIAVDEKYADQMSKLGFSKSKEQPA